MVVFATRKLKRAARIILVGAPGVGKGTQAERLIQRYPQLTTVSSGDLLRNAVAAKNAIGRASFGTCDLLAHSGLGMEAESYMKSGALVPDATILKLILSESVVESPISP